MLAAAILPYLPALGFAFVYDDDVVVLGNPAIRAWSFLPSYFLKPVFGFYNAAQSAHYYRPLVLLWLRLNDFLFGLKNPWGWHLTNIALHAAASVLVLLVLRQYFRDPRWSVVGALVFAAHPAHIETVAWVSGCTDSLMAVALLASSYFWLTAGDAPRRRFSSLACFALALLTKETAIILPFIIFFHVLLGIPGSESISESPIQRFFRAFRQAIPYAILAVLYAAIRFTVFRGVSKLPGWISSHDALLTAPAVLLFYVRHALWPINLSVLYDFPIARQSVSPLFWAPLISLSVILAITLLWFRRTKDTRILAAALWFLLPLLPVLYIGLFQPDDFIQDRYLYLPILGLSIAIALLCESLSHLRIAQTQPTLPLALPAAIVLALAIATLTQIQPWSNNLSLYSNAVRIAPRNALARNNLASECSKAGRYQDAADLLSSLLRDQPNRWLANYNYGFVNYRLGNLPLAQEYLGRAIRLDPNEADQYIYLGTTYLKEGQLQSAEEQVRAGISRKPDGVGYHFVLGVIKMQQGNLPAARDAMLEELKYHPESEAAQAQLQGISAQLQKQ